MIFMLVYVMFSFWIQICRKLYFTNLGNPKNPNLNLDSMDYSCEIRLEVHQRIHNPDSDSSDITSESVDLKNLDSMDYSCEIRRATRRILQP